MFMASKPCIAANISDAMLIAGIVLTIIMAIYIRIAINYKTFRIDTENAKICRLGRFEYKPKVICKYIKLAILHLLVMFCIATVGGIIDASWLTEMFTSMFKDVRLPSLGEFIFTVFVFLSASFVIAIIPVALTYMVGFIVLGLYRFTEKYSQAIFQITFLLSIVLWCGYFINYNANIEYTTEVIESAEERELGLFYEIPVQHVNGNSVRGNGKTFTVDSVLYAYVNESGNGEWDSAPTKNSEIIFITEDELPKVVITTRTEKEIKIDHNNDTSVVTGQSCNVKYYFYIPKSVLQSSETG